VVHIQEKHLVFANRTEKWNFYPISAISPDALAFSVGMRIYKLRSAGVSDGNGTTQAAFQPRISYDTTSLLAYSEKADTLMYQCEIIFSPKADRLLFAEEFNKGPQLGQKFQTSVKVTVFDCRTGSDLELHEVASVSPSHYNYGISNLAFHPTMPIFTFAIRGPQLNTHGISIWNFLLSKFRDFQY
jgi:hypothetical protein